MRKADSSSRRDAGDGKTHDWALDLEPLALPPDLPPVILKEFGWGGLFEKVGVVREMG
jgi:hypothetical protein